MKKLGFCWLFYIRSSNTIKEQFRSSMSFGFAHYLKVHPKAISSGKHFIKLLTKYVTLTSWKLTLLILPLSSANSSCHPITCTMWYATSYWGSHTFLTWFLTNTLSSNMEFWHKICCKLIFFLSLNTLILWVSNACMSLSTKSKKTFIITHISDLRYSKLH